MNEPKLHPNESDLKDKMLKKDLKNRSVYDTSATVLITTLL